MRPTSLRRRPPRDPRARLGGLMMLPRTVDKARALLPGGDPGDYAITPGLSAWLLGELGFTEPEFLEFVRRAADEQEIAAVALTRVPPEGRECLNAFMRSVRVCDLTPEHRAHFTRAHTLGPEHDELLVIDVLIDDDRDLVNSRIALPGA
ncbi:MAG: DUF5069 domain-containing protein [Candidatus Eremiobacteraeota bacterium]|nr:DUF5069 domain-containing protein [Candidatus Eremiobacteraeota bacterium]